MNEVIDKIKVSDLVPAMLSAARKIIGEDWIQTKAALKIEIKAAARSLKEIVKAFAAGEINEKTAGYLVKMIKLNLISVVAGIINQAKIAAEDVVNAILGVVKNAINTAIGFALL